MDEKAIRSLNQEYEDAKLRRGGWGLREVTPQDLKIYDAYQDSKKKNQYLSFKELGKRFKSSESQVRTSLLRAALLKS